MSGIFTYRARLAGRSDRRHQRSRATLEIAHKVALAARLGALREPTVLLYGLPLLSDKVQRCSSVLDSAGLDEPASDDDASASDTTTAVHGCDTSSARVVTEDVEDLPDVGLRAREAAVGYREGVVFDVVWLDAAYARDMRCEVWCVWGELATLCKIDERPHACAQ